MLPSLVRASGVLSLAAFAVFVTAAALAADSANGASGAPAAGGKEICQVAVLRNGFTMEIARREAAGQATRLWLCGGADAGYVEVPSEQIEGFEQRQIPVPAAPPAPPATPKAIPSDLRPVLTMDAVKNSIASAASRHQIDPDFVASVVKAESGFNPTAVSPKGAKGLMQLMPQTAASMGVQDVLDPAANVEGGTKYLRQLLDQYKGDAAKALAAYNAGPQRVAQYGGVPPYRETRAYITRIIEDYNRKKVQQQTPSSVPAGK